MAPLNYSDRLLKNVHYNLATPTTTGKSYTICGDYVYYHYGCDGFDDRGWGCGYRTLQMMISWISMRLAEKSTCDIPNIPAIQKILVSMEDKPESFFGSRDWIGSYEVCLVIDKLFDIPSKILHIKREEKLFTYLPKLRHHFETFQSPIMMGGDVDCSSKGVLGIHLGDEGSNSSVYLLIVDPHFYGVATSAEELQSKGWVQWVPIENFMDMSFYNVCQPQIKFKD